MELDRIGAMRIRERAKLLNDEYEARLAEVNRIADWTGYGDEDEDLVLQRIREDLAALDRELGDE